MTFHVNVNGKTPAITEQAVIVCNNDGYELAVTFSEEWAINVWAALSFVRHGKLENRLAVVVNGTADLPPIDGTDALQVRFKDGTNESDTVTIPCMRDATDDAGEAEEVHTDVYNYAMGVVHNLGVG